MADGFMVDPDQLQAHALRVQAVYDRFNAVTTASSHISQDESAYGLLCGWIAGILEGKHQQQDELIAFAAENLDLVVESLRDAATSYEEADYEGAIDFDDTLIQLDGGKP